MGTIQQTGRKTKPFIKLRTMDANCRCCGKGNQWVCDGCNNLLDTGHAFFIEVKNSATDQHKKPTGYAIAFKAADVYENGKPGEAMLPGIYFIRENDLKNFLGDGYDKLTRGNFSTNSGRFLNSTPKWGSSDRGTAAGTRSSTELVHR